MRYFLGLLAAMVCWSSIGIGAGKDQLPVYSIIAAGDLSGNLTSTSVDVRGWDNVDLEIVATGSPTGTFAVDCTILAVAPPGPVAQTWVALTLSPVPTLSGSASNIVIELNQTGCSYIRLRYVFTSGTGTVNAYARAKMI